MQGLEGILVEDARDTPDPTMLEDEQVGLVEVMLSPHSKLSRYEPEETQFPGKNTVSPYWLSGERAAPTKTIFGTWPLPSGMRFFCTVQGKNWFFWAANPISWCSRKRPSKRPREEKAKVALGIMAAVLLPVIMGWVPIYIAVVIGAAFMVITGCLTMEEAHRYIEWKAVFLIAGMLPLGTALEKTGAARILAEGVIGTLGPLGPHAVLFGLLFITFAATCIIPTSALVVLMVPIALELRRGIGNFPLCPHDGYCHGGLLQFYLSHFPSSQRSGDGAGRVSFHRLRQGRRSSDPVGPDYSDGCAAHFLAIIRACSDSAKRHQIILFAMLSSRFPLCHQP